MKRDVVTTEIFRSVAQKATTERTIGENKPNSRTFLDALAGEIIDNKGTTGDELVDALVAWYSSRLEPTTVERFHMLDTSLKGKIGETAMVVWRTLRGSGYSAGNRSVRTSYDVGVITDDNLTCNLIEGTCIIPTDGYTELPPWNDAMYRKTGSLVVTRIAACGFDNEYRFLGSGSPDLSKRFSVDGRIESAFDPAAYETAIDAAESRQPHAQVVIGLDAVIDYVAQNEHARNRFSMPDAPSLITF